MILESNRIAAVVNGIGFIIAGTIAVQSQIDEHKPEPKIAYAGFFVYAVGWMSVGLAASMTDDGRVDHDLYAFPGVVALIGFPAVALFTLLPVVRDLVHNEHVPRPMQYRVGAIAYAAMWTLFAVGVAYRNGDWDGARGGIVAGGAVSEIIGVYLFDRIRPYSFIDGDHNHAGATSPYNIGMLFYIGGWLAVAVGILYS